MSFATFLTQLAQHPSSPDLTNPYQTNWNRYNKARRHNLQRYFEQMQTHQPTVLLVGEAPGYRGCRLSGVPFVSCQLLEDGLSNIPLFGTESGYQTTMEWEGVQREASSTIMWETIAQLSTLPLLWNACPFHPHPSNQPQANRTPTTGELDLGRPFLEKLLTLFPITTVIAVGNRADHALTRWQVDHYKVRHPSHGGKRPFQQQLFALLQN